MFIVCYLDILSVPFGAVFDQIQCFPPRNIICFVVLLFDIIWACFLYTSLLFLRKHYALAEKITVFRFLCCVLRSLHVVFYMVLSVNLTSMFVYLFWYFFYAELTSILVIEIRVKLVNLLLKIVALYTLFFILNCILFFIRVIVVDL